MTTRITPLKSAYLKGLSAALAGEPITACPYQDKRKLDGRLTWSRAFQTAWRDGWEHATKNREDALITSMYARKR
jgi:ribosome modulation factor